MLNYRAFHYCQTYIFWLLVFLHLGSLSLLAQERDTRRWELEFSLGTDVGWWAYDKGTPASSSGFNTLGQDITHSSITVSTEIDILYRIKSWKLGAGLNVALLIENEMVGSDDSEFQFDRYDIAESAVGFINYYGIVEWGIVRKPKYELAPHFRLGSFQISTLHPEEDNFGTRWYGEIGINNQFYWKRLSFILRPKYRFQRILPKQEQAEGEKHRFFGVGLQMGLRYAIF